MVNKEISGKIIFYITLVLLSLLVSFFSIDFGSSNVRFIDFILMSNGDKRIITLRTLHSFAIFLSGCCLSVSGFVLQRIMKNNLVDPGITGVLAGSALGVTLFSLINFNIPGMYSIIKVIFAITFGIIAGSILLIVSLVYKDSLKVVVFGVMINSFLSGLIVLVQSLLDPYKLQQTFSFLTGGIILNSFELILIGYIIAITVIIILISFSKKLDIISLGDIDAHVLGVNIRFWRSLFLILVVLLSSISVSISGVISFVGFIIPNIINFMYHKVSWINTKNGIVISALLGSIFLTFCYVLSKVLLPLYQLPLGVITGLIGSPLFAIIIFRLSQK
ncbi:MAG: FecCD family ABC transporter permease [Brevinematia bacterium]